MARESVRLAFSSRGFFPIPSHGRSTVLNRVPAILLKTLYPVDTTPPRRTLDRIQVRCSVFFSPFGRVNQSAGDAKGLCDSHENRSTLHQTCG